MAKKVVTVITVKTEDGFIEPGQVLDVSKFTKADLERLSDMGAIKIEDVEETTTEDAPPPPSTPLNPETPKTETATPVEAVPQKGVTSPVGKVTANDKGVTK